MRSTSAIPIMHTWCQPPWSPFCCPYIHTSPSPLLWREILPLVHTPSPTEGSRDLSIWDRWVARLAAEAGSVPHLTYSVSLIFQWQPQKCPWSNVNEQARHKHSVTHSCLLERGSIRRERIQGVLCNLSLSTGNTTLREQVTFQMRSYQNLQFYLPSLLKIHIRSISKTITSH